MDVKPSYVRSLLNWRRFSRVGVVITVATLVGLAVRLYQVSRPGYLYGITEYDDGVYFGFAVRLLQGDVPYRDFSAVQPPGVIVVMAPVALLAKVIGTASGLAVARVLTACVGAVNVALVGRLVAHRGALAAFVACGVLAVYPDDVAAAHTLLLEPWLNLFCLIGAVCVFDGDSVASRPRLIWGAVLFGFAGAIKVWAIVPVLIVLVLLLATHRFRKAAHFGAGVAAGFLVTVVPFALGAPATFFNSVIVAQLSRTDVSRVPTWARLLSLVGLTNVTGMTPTSTVAVSLTVAVLIIGTYAATWLARRQPLVALEIYALAGATAIVGMFLWPADFYYHYTAFFVPFLAMVVGLAVARLAAWPWARWGTVTAILLAIAGMGFGQIQREANASPVYVPQAAVYQDIPPGSCVLTDQASLTIAIDRFVSTVPGCSLMVDSVGTDYALSDGHNAASGAGSNPAVRAAWATAFAHAQFVWLSGLNARRIPWTPALTAYFKTNFRPVPGVVELFQRDTAQ